MTNDLAELAERDAIIHDLVEALKFVEPLVKVGGVTRIEQTAARVKVRAALSRAQVQP